MDSLNGIGRVHGCPIEIHPSLPFTVQNLATVMSNRIGLGCGSQKLRTLGPRPFG